MRLGDFQSKPVIKRRTPSQPIFHITNASIESELSKTKDTIKTLTEQLNKSQADYYASEAAHTHVRTLLSEAEHRTEQAVAETLNLSLTIERLAPFENDFSELSRQHKERESNILNLNSELQAVQEQTAQRGRDVEAAQGELASLKTDYVDAQTELVKAHQLESAHVNTEDHLKAQLGELQNNIEKLLPFQIKVHETETKYNEEQQRTYDLALKVKALTEILTEAYEQLQVNSSDLKKRSEESSSFTATIEDLRQTRDSFKNQEFILRNQYNILVTKTGLEREHLTTAQARILELETALAHDKSVIEEKQAVILKLYDDSKAQNTVFAGRTDFKMPLLKENLRLKNLGTRPPTLLKFKAASEGSYNDNDKQPVETRSRTYAELL